MELQSEHRILRILHRHHLIVLRLRNDAKVIRKCFLNCRKRVISCNRNFLWQPLENRAFRIYLRHGLFAMHQPFRIADRRAVGLTDPLLTKTNPEDRDLRPKLPDHILTDACIRRAPRAGRQDNLLRLPFFDLLHGQLIVPDHPNVRLKGSHHLIQVVGEAVIIINQQDHWPPPVPSQRLLLC